MRSRVDVGDNGSKGSLLVEVPRGTSTSTRPDPEARICPAATKNAAMGLAIIAMSTVVMVAPPDPIIQFSVGVLGGWCIT